MRNRLFKVVPVRRDGILLDKDINMRVRLFKDETVAIRLNDIVKNLCTLAPSFAFSVGRAKFSVPGPMVISPQTYKKLDGGIAKESAKDDLALLFTEKPYDNNYFWESEGKQIIISLYGWDHLTNLSRNNGAVYFICAVLVRHLGIGTIHGEKNTGCINDFWQDKTGVDIGMRTAFICGKCLKARGPGVSEEQGRLSEEIQSVLSALSDASRAGMDICDFLMHEEKDDAFDVFMCHNSEEKDLVREVNKRLQQEGISTWLDEEQLPPGRLWQDLLEEQIESVKTAAVFVGDSGTGPWQHMEIRAFLQQFVRRKCPVIPVILPNCKNVPQLPLFLSQLTWVDFRKTKPNPIYQLLWGITGVKRATR